MRRAIARLALNKATAGRGGEVVSQATAAAGEMLRVRRDPGVIAARRVRSAKRRMTLWSVAGALPAAGLAVQVLNHGTAAFASAEVLRTLLYLAALIVCIAGVVRGVVDYRQRRRSQRALPPPAPARTTVVAPIRNAITQLNEYSDGLRALAGHTGIDPASPMADELRRDIVSSADLAERALRRRAAEFGDLHRAAGTAPHDARDGLRATAERLSSEIVAGVVEYGNYVTAVSEIVVAARSLRPDSSVLVERTEALRSLAIGMREIAG